MKKNNNLIDLMQAVIDVMQVIKGCSYEAFLQHNQKSVLARLVQNYM